MTELPLVAVIFTILTLLVLIIGVVFMAKGGSINKKLSNKLMFLRVAFQSIAIALIVIGVLFTL